MPSEQPERQAPLTAPPVGIEPRFIWIEKRRDNLYGAISRYRNAMKAPEIEWLKELVDLESEIQGWDSK